MTHILVTGASGNVGSVVVRELRRGGVQPRSGVRPTGEATSPHEVAFDFRDPRTWDAAFDGEAMYVVRPPALRWTTNCCARRRDRPYRRFTSS